MQIRYVQIDGLFLVSLIGFNQRLVTNPRRFCRITGASPRAVLGCMDVTPEVVAAIGFIFPEEVSANACDLHSAEPAVASA
ncbi:hypothetical protein [Paenibacillus sp.]|uniref:hypothetical protein n=1 Tax=Paenibacillus sp. TaxID=58172 RepID=UPI002D2F9E98|nr:hypothetical protein [Paenibacillus sp.]HZG87292.1 hypothetical protein [Paenibacillus sp.]